MVSGTLDSLSQSRHHVPLHGQRPHLHHSEWSFQANRPCSTSPGLRHDILDNKSLQLVCGDGKSPTARTCVRTYARALSGLRGREALPVRLRVLPGGPCQPRCGPEAGAALLPARTKPLWLWHQSCKSINRKHSQNEDYHLLLNQFLEKRRVLPFLWWSEVRGVTSHKVLLVSRTLTCHFYNKHCSVYNKSVELCLRWEWSIEQASSRESRVDHKTLRSLQLQGTL